MGERSASAALVHENRRGTAREGIRTALRLAREGTISPAPHAEAHAGATMNGAEPTISRGHEHAAGSAADRSSVAAAVDDEEARIRRLEAELADAKVRVATLRADLAKTD